MPPFSLRARLATAAVATVTLAATAATGIHGLTSEDESPNQALSVASSNPNSDIPASDGLAAESDAADAPREVAAAKTKREKTAKASRSQTRGELPTTSTKDGSAASPSASAKPAASAPNKAPSKAPSKSSSNAKAPQVSYSARALGEQLYLGAAGDNARFEELQRRSNMPLARHTYANLQGSVPTSRMITVNASGIPWREVANARPGSALYANMVRWADTIKTRSAPQLLAFGHEPEVSHKAYLGSPQEYQAAYRNVVNVFRSEGVNNVQWVFQLTAWSYRTSTSSSTAAIKYYPGDSYVDVIGGDAYNWYTCGETRDRAKWVPLSTIASGVLAFAKAHDKKAALPEYGSNQGPQRAQWLLDGYNWMKDNKEYFVGAYYFNRTPTNRSNGDCVWYLQTDAEIAAWRTIQNDSWSVN